MRWKALVVLLVVFLLGIGGGIVVDRVVLSPFGAVGHARRSPARLLHRLTRTLDLSEAQQTDVRRILKATRAELGTLRRNMRQEVHAVLASSERRITEVLKPDQRDAFRTLMAEHRARRHRWFRPRHWGKSPPPPAPPN
ncbi:MAG: hypothetical protein OEU26_01905 [Candidatus Tectomicrobia bacterium]|nr:hypothetical protein [Candidatus Tectomicrobia bacterium]